MLEPDEDLRIEFDDSTWELRPEVNYTESQCCRSCHVPAIYGMRVAGEQYCPQVPCLRHENSTGSNCYLVIIRNL